MMTVNDLNYAATSAADERANSLRHWIGLITAVVDLVMVVGIVVGTSFAYHLYAYGDFGNDKITLKLASMIAAIFVFINALRGRYFEPAPEFNVYGGLTVVARL